MEQEQNELKDGSHAQLLAELEQISSTAARRMAEYEVDEEIVRHPQLVSLRDKKLKQLFETKQQEIFKALSEEFWSFTHVSDYLTPFLEKEVPELREKHTEDLEKLAHLDGYADAVAKDETLTIQKYCDISQETLNFLYATSLILIEEKKFEKSSTLVKFLLLLDPNLSDAWLTYGYSLKEQSLHEKAIEAFATASALDPNFAESFIFATESYLALREVNEAHNQFTQLENILPTHPKREELEGHVNKLRMTLNQGV